jgi:hypothetical protein
MGGPLHENDVIRSGSGSPNDSRVIERQVVALPVKRGSLPASISTGTAVSLLFSPRDTKYKEATPEIVPDIALVSIERRAGDDTVVVAATAGQLNRIARLAGTCDVYVVAEAR